MKKIETIVLFLSLSLVIFLHFCYFKEICYDRDVSGYVYNTLSVMDGHGWYYTPWHPKPPGINFIILAAFNLFGKSFKSIYLIALFFNLTAVSLLYFFAKFIIAKETKLYFLLLLFFMLLYGSKAFDAHSANTEVFLLPFEIGGVILLGLNRYFISGLLLGFGFLIRQSGFWAFFSGVIFIFLINILDKRPHKNTIKDLLKFSFSFILPIFLVSIYFLRAGVFDKFLKYTFLYNLQHLGKYVVDIRHRDIVVFTWNRLWSNLGFEIIFFSLLSLLGIFFALMNRSKNKFLIVLWFVASCIGLLISAVYPHHFIQIIAPLAAVSLFGVLAVFESISSFFRRKTYLRNIFIGIFTVILLIPYIRLAIPFVNKTRLAHYAFATEDRFYAAQYIKEHTLLEDKIFIWDTLRVGEIILWSERKSITRFHEKYAFLPPELRQYWIPYVEDYRVNQKELLLDFSKDRPKYIILVRDYKIISSVDNGLNLHKLEMIDVRHERGAFPEFFQIVENDYLLEKVIERCLIYRIKK